MARILQILEDFLKEIEKDNPFNLVAKGGTALSIYYLNHHRESEDLDFDADKSLIGKHKDIEKYLSNILEKLKQNRKISDYKIPKSGFAATNRYHMKLDLKTYKTFYSKIDIDFVDLPGNLIKMGHLNLYSPERAFVAKAAAFVNRKEFKDIYDMAYLMDKINISSFKNKENTIQLIQNVIRAVQEEDIKKMFKLSFRNIDLRFKNLKEPQLEKFIQKTIKELRILVNKLKGD